MGLTLYDIPEAIREALDNPEVVDHETGELLQPEVLEALEADKGRLVLWYARRIKELLAEAVAVKTEQQKLTARVTALENRAEKFKERVALVCEKGDKFKDECSRVNILETAGKVVVINEEAIPDKYKDQPPTPDPVLNKKTLLADLKLLDEGEEIKGASIEKRTYAKVA